MLQEVREKSVLKVIRNTRKSETCATVGAILHKSKEKVDLYSSRKVGECPLKVRQMTRVACTYIGK